MSHQDIKTLISQGKVMLPGEAPSEITVGTLKPPLDRVEADVSTTLLDSSPVNSDITTRYPVLLPDTASTSKRNMEQLNKPASIAMGSTAFQTHEKVTDPVIVKANKKPSTRSRTSRNSRLQEGQQVAKTPLKALSPIHEEDANEELVKPAPLLAASENQFEPLTTSFSNQSSLCHEPTNYLEQYHPNDHLFTNPPCMPQFYMPSQAQPQPSFNTDNMPPKPYLDQSFEPQEASHTYRMAQTQPSNLSPTKMSHRHPSYKRLTLSTEDTAPGCAINALLAEPHYFSYNRPYALTNCSLRTCNNPTTSMDISTCICPRCGPFSVVRYCSIAHLHADIRRHYIEDCTRRANMLALIATGTLEPFNRPARTFIPANLPNDDSLERHRQAVYRSYPTTQQIDYSVFDDADLLIAGEPEDFVPSPELMARYRGHGKVIARVAMHEKSVVKVQFAGTLEKLLAMGVSAGQNAPDKCRLLFSWIKVYFEGEGQWHESMMNRVALAMQLEFGYRVPLKLFESTGHLGA